MRVYDVSFSDRLQSIVMEFIDGITLKEYIEHNFFDENGWIIKDGYFKIGNQIIFATGDYFMGASNFANAASLAKKTIKMLEKLK